MAKTGKFPVVGDVLVLLILFFVSQLIVASLLQVFGLALPATPAIDTVPIDEYILPLCFPSHKPKAAQQCPAEKRCGHTRETKPNIWISVVWCLM